MDNRFKQLLKLLLAGMALGLLLSGCNEYYDRPDNDYNPGYNPGYDPGYGGVSDRRMIRNCKLRVENKISRKLGYDAQIDFGYADVSDTSRYRSRIKGDAYVSNRDKRLRVDYRCTVEIDNGEVTDVKLDWRDKPGNIGNKTNAASTCKSHISRKVRRDIPGKISIDFRKHDSSGMSGKRRRVTGNAHIIAGRGTGKIRYECVVDTNYMRVDNANYRWTQHLPSGGNGGNGGHGQDKGKNNAKRKCHKSITNKLKQDGYKGIKFKSTKFSAVGKSDLLVKGKLNMRYQDSHHRAGYQCRVNSASGNVKSADYWLDHK